MSCFLEETAGKINAVLVFKRSQLLYDIKNYLYIEGSVLETQNNHQRHMVQDGGEQGNVDRLARVLDLTVAKCKEAMYPYTKQEIYRPVLDNRLKEHRVYGIVLDVPQDFSQTTLILLERLIHEYLVCTAVADWLSITNPPKSEVWTLKAANAISEARTSLVSRMRPLRRPLSPF